MAERISTGAECIYGTGFTSHAPRGPMKLMVDNKVIDLYSRLNGDKLLAQSFAFKQEVVAVTARLLFPLGNWMLAQRMSTIHSKYAILFVNDIATVALGGDRPMSVRTRMCLFGPKAVQSNPSRLEADAKEAKTLMPMAFIDRIRETSSGTLLANLTRDPECVIDQVNSLYVMFGSVE